ncbi:TetR/AcrR family transcriptional regulator [Pseudonocardia sp. WMMC193]|uniref:TetR/AcrR family transcriptional regulator n=1 Tax=Pseudonocardia sp. WMMC193 TaxID=2911965 RepID=UPI001F3BDD59|nr:TetR/AcrR family transcriptional regulator [Pseudonocardia sp. WMMC193]MCF7549530.1 TetR/AcrR family transcriptional regulator [Pseudonocardia sp. WMMC193]
MAKGSDGDRKRSPRARVSDPATAILLAAEACFLRLGITKATMDDVAREAGVSRPTVYRHYATRDDLITGVLLARARDLLDRARRFIDTRSTIDAKIVDGMVFLVDAGRRDPMVLQLVSLEFLEVANRVSDTPKLATDLTAELWSDILAEAKSAGEVRPDLDIDRFCAWLTFVELILVGRIERLGAEDPSHRRLLERYIVPALHKAVPYESARPA